MENTSESVNDVMAETSSYFFEVTNATAVMTLKQNIALIASFLMACK